MRSLKIHNAAALRADYLTSVPPFAYGAIPYLIAWTNRIGGFGGDGPVQFDSELSPLYGMNSSFQSPACTRSTHPQPKGMMIGRSFTNPNVGLFKCIFCRYLSPFIAVADNSLATSSRPCSCPRAGPGRLVPSAAATTDSGGLQWAVSVGPSNDPKRDPTLGRHKSSCIRINCQRQCRSRGDRQ